MNQIPTEEQLTAYDVFIWISSVYCGKQMYFAQNNGTIYDRYNCDYVSLEEAINRFTKIIEMD